MKSLDPLEPVEWARKVNSRWIVHNNLDQSADSWIDHLQATDPARLLRSCGLARAMCGMRGPLDDPKPWFYSGLFHEATAEEANRFLSRYRVTRATVPTMQDDEAVLLWRDRISPETKILVERMREACRVLTG